MRVKSVITDILRFAWRGLSRAQDRAAAGARRRGAVNRPGPRLSLVTAIGAGVVAVPLCLADDTSSVSPRLYHPETADQFQWPVLEDVVPRDAEARRTWAQALAFDATLYGTVSVLQYRQMYA